MASYFGKQTDGMSFLTGDVKDYLACCLAYRHAQDTLAAWLQGRERFYAVQFVIDEFRTLFGPGAVRPVALILEAVTLEPDDDQDECGARVRLVTEALDMIGQQLRAAEAVTHVPYRD